jgi:DNA repair protein RecN (Recombination protein N)
VGGALSAAVMLRELRIRNLAVIDEVVLELKPGLNIITGETGAGKTIILDALGLIAGQRGSTDVIRNREDEASVEALFDSLPEELSEKLGNAGFEAEDEIVVKRIVSRSGKNRIYLNGSLAPRAVLAEIGATLVQIYGQHEHQTLLQPETHLSLLDGFAELEAPARSMQMSYKILTASWNELNQVKQSIEQKRREKALLETQLEELERARLKPGEEEELRAAKNVLAHSEKLYQGCREGEDLLYESDAALVGRLGKYSGRLRELAGVDQHLRPTVELLESSLAQLQEAAAQLRRYAERIHFDRNSLEQVEERLAEIQRLKRKYGGSVEDILRLHEEIRESLGSLEQGESKIAALEKTFADVRQTAWDAAEKISTARQRAAKKLKRDMEREVRTLGMPETTFEVRFTTHDEKADVPPFFVGGKKLTERGMDQVEFYFSPNPGEPPKPLARIASGGELSRLMLALKALVLTASDASTLLFDEVDAGIGGRVAEIVGKKLKQVAARQQVLSVTHLPQIAALADAHYVVEKEVEQGRTFTRVKQLSERDRIAEIARMLGGIKITDQARRHAEELVRSK